MRVTAAATTVPGRRQQAIQDAPSRPATVRIIGRPQLIDTKTIPPRMAHIVAATRACENERRAAAPCSRLKTDNSRSPEANPADRIGNSRTRTAGALRRRNDPTPVACTAPPRMSTDDRRAVVLKKKKTPVVAPTRARMITGKANRMREDAGYPSASKARSSKPKVRTWARSKEIVAVETMTPTRSMPMMICGPVSRRKNHARVRTFIPSRAA